MHGSWLPILRTGWIVLSIFALSIFIASLPVYLANERTTYTLGYSISILALNIFATLLWFVVALLIFWRKSNDWLALLVSLMLVMQGANGIISSLNAIPLVLQVPAQILNVLAFFLLFLVFSLFPTGRFVPRWIAWLVVPFLAVQMVGAFNLVSSSSSYTLLTYLLVWYCFLGSFVVSQIYRYRSVSSRTERQQTKWIVFGVLTTYLIEAGFSIYFSLFAAALQTGSLADLILTPIGNVAPVLIPLSFGFAILRYRLWDIDSIINRTLVYGTLTALLALIYFGSVIGLQFLLHGLTGGNQFAIIGSTLLIAALFQPLRHSLQNNIDRRFYRYKYDAAHTLETFSVFLREEVDLNQLSERLLAVVEETMQPSHATLWLRTTEWSDERKTLRLPQIDE